MSVKKMIDSDKVKVIIGPSTTGTTLAVSSICERAKVPIISCAAGNKITTPARPYIFKTAQADTYAIAKIIDYLKSKKLTRVAFINDSNAFGSSGLEQMKLQAAKAKITLVAIESFGSKDSDMSSQLTRIKGKKPQAIVCWGTNPGPAILVRNARQLGIKVPIVMSHGVANKKFIELAGPDANGVILPAGKLTVASQIPSSDPQKKVLLQYQSMFKKKYGRDADAFGGYAWDSAQLVTRAMKKVGDNPAKIRSEIERTKHFVGVSGVFNFSPKEHNGLNKSAFVMVRVEKGGFKLIK
jgi:branched-chain amino acid transport system substrate-binding protein